MVAVPRQSPSFRAIGGFTLIELMVVVVVIAILAAIALPTYTDYVRRSRRAEAITLLNRIAQEQERWRANNTTYTATMGNLFPMAPGSAPAATYYVAAVASATATGYVTSASSVGVQTGDTKCQTLTLTMATGNITYSNTGTAASAVCWGR